MTTNLGPQSSSADLMIQAFKILMKLWNSW